MKFSLSREVLLKPLQLVVGVVERRQTLPILSNVLLSLEGSRLSVTGTDLEVEIIGYTEVSAAEEAGEVTVVKVDTADNVADVLTKPLPRERHRRLAALMRSGWSLLQRRS